MDGATAPSLCSIPSCLAQQRLDTCRLSSRVFALARSRREAQHFLETTDTCSIRSRCCQVSKTEFITGPRGHMPWRTVLATLNTQDPRHRCSTGLLDSPFLRVTTCELNQIHRRTRVTPLLQGSLPRVRCTTALRHPTKPLQHRDQGRRAALDVELPKLRPYHDSACRPMVARSSAQDSAQTPGLCDDVRRTLHHPSTPRVAHGKHWSLANDATNPPRLCIDDDKARRAMQSFEPRKKRVHNIRSGHTFENRIHPSTLRPERLEDPGEHSTSAP